MSDAPAPPPPDAPTEAVFAGAPEQAAGTAPAAPRSRSRRAQKALDALGAAIHAVHGTRGLLWVALILMALAILEPALPEKVSRLGLLLPALLLLAVGLGTLPRNAVSSIERARRVPQHDRPAAVLARRLPWLALLCVLLLPRIFLAAYGIPHLNPLTGLILPDLQRRMALVFLFVVMLLPIVYVRSMRAYARDVHARRPRDMRLEPSTIRRRDILLLAMALLAVLWAWFLRPFWQPFSLLDIPPGLESLHAGVRGLHAIAFALVVPLVLFLSLVAHLELVRELRSRGGRPAPEVAALAALHIVLVVVAIALHAYDLLWIVRYESGSAFLS